MAEEMMFSNNAKTLWKEKVMFNKRKALRLVLGLLLMIVVVGTSSLVRQAVSAQGGDEAAVRDALLKSASTFEKNDLAEATKVWVNDDSLTVFESGHANYGWADYRDKVDFDQDFSIQSNGDEEEARILNPFARAGRRRLCRSSTAPWRERMRHGRDDGRYGLLQSGTHESRNGAIGGCAIMLCGQLLARRRDAACRSESTVTITDCYFDNASGGHAGAHNSDGGVASHQRVTWPSR